MKKNFFEKRAHFRCDMIKPVEAFSTIVSVNNVLTNLNRPFNVSILDLSVGGLKIKSSLDLPIESNLILAIKFRLEEEAFTLLFKPIRRSINGSDIEYGGKFVNLNGGEELKLGRTLNRYKIKTSKITPDQLVKDKQIGVFVKIIEAIPEPAYLINLQHVILASNNKAHQLGAKVGERCHSTICKTKKTCANCLLEESNKNDEIISNIITTDNEEKYNAHWLYLQPDLYLHYMTKMNTAMSSN